MRFLRRLRPPKPPVMASRVDVEKNLQMAEALVAMATRLHQKLMAEGRSR